MQINWHILTLALQLCMMWTKRHLDGKKIYNLCIWNMQNVKPGHCAAKECLHWCSSDLGEASHHRKLGWCWALDAVRGTWPRAIIFHWEHNLIVEVLAESRRRNCLIPSIPLQSQCHFLLPKHHLEKNIYSANVQDESLKNLM